MDKFIRKQKFAAKHPVIFLAGLLLGGLAGAATLYLFVYRSGKKTPQQIRQKVMELRDQTAATMEDAMVQVRAKTSQIKEDLSDKAKELKQQGRDMLVGQLDRVTTAVETGKKVIQGNHN